MIHILEDILEIMKEIKYLLIEHNDEIGNIKEKIDKIEDTLDNEFN